MTTYTLIAGETVGLVCWSYRTPVDAALNHSNNSALKQTLNSRMQGRSGYRRGFNRLSDEGEAGDVIFLPIQTTVRASPGSNTVQGRDALAERMRHYLNVAYRTAFGSSVAGKEQGGSLWNEVRGYAHNRPTIIRVYDYYRDTYNRNPAGFLWAGLGRMAGGAVVGGLDFMMNANDQAHTAGRYGVVLAPLAGGLLGGVAAIAFDALLGYVRRIMPVIERFMVRIGKDIFWDLAWLHEAMADTATPNRAVELGRLYDSFPRISLSGSQTPAAYIRAARRYVGSRVSGNRSLGYGTATQQILSGSAADKELAAVAYLANEQMIIIQPKYDAMMRALLNNHVFEHVLEPIVALVIRYATSFLTDNIHPYHRPFWGPQGAMNLTSNVFDRYHRWRWISGGYGTTRIPHPMWAKWMTIGQAERTRLINLDFEGRIIQDNYDPVQRQRLPPHQ